MRPGRADEELGPHVAEREPDHFGRAGLDPQPPGDERGRDPPWHHVDHVDPDAVALRRRDRQAVSHRVPIPVRSGRRERVQRPRRREVVAENPDRVPHIPRYEPRPVKHAGKIPLRVAGTEPPPNHVDPEIVGLPPLDARLLLFDRGNRDLGPAAPPRRGGQAIADSCPVIRDRAVLSAMPRHGPHDELAGDGVGEWGSRVG